jgi:cytochrome b561
MGVLAATVQVLLYVLLFALPITAVSGAWLEGHPLTLLGGITVEPLLAQNHSLGETLAELHGWLGDAILWVAGLHALAALYHHWVLGDGVLVSILPGWLPLRVRRGA